MSISEFTSAVKKKIFTDWLSLTESNNILADSNIYVKLRKEVSTTSASATLSYTFKDNEDPKLQKSIGKVLPKLPTEALTEEILSIRSSPSFVDILKAGLLKALQGIDRQPNTVITSPSIQVHKKTSSKQIRDSAGKFYSLALLQELINDNLPHVLSANMGPYFGNQRKILNFRTGRFANSARVDRMSQNKEGMITAFYSYMKYPYATFSKGGKQYTPSREPKLLIAKSIKEIAATKVALKMRAVNI